VARKQGFLDPDFSTQFDESYAALQQQQQTGADKVILALLKGAPTPGMRIKPIEPEKYYYEARINDGDRLVHRVDGGTVYFVDIVNHDYIDRYGRRR
jgi:Txe/YoeB family toxin of Txe-Axe toxin-antitoxin module